MSQTSRRAAVVFMFGAAITAGTLAQGPPVFRAGVDAVLVDVEVLDGGRAVTGLTRADFEVLDNGVPQTIDAGLQKNIPIDLTLLLDTSGSVEGTRLDRLKSGVRDTAQWLASDDRWRVISVEHVLHVVVPLEPPGKPAAIDALQPSGGTALYDGIIAALIHPRAVGRRQMLVVYTDGDDVSSISSAAAMLDVARLSDSVVQVVIPVENARALTEGSALTRPHVTAPTPPEAAAETGQTDQGAWFPNEETFAELTSRTGGRIFIVDYNESVGAAFKRVIDAFRTSYVLRYTRTGVPKEGWHDLVVKVNRPGHFEVHARKGYWGG